MKIRILSWLLHHANRLGKDENFYKIKKSLLTKYGAVVGYDVQFIEGKKCRACGGTGVYVLYSGDVDTCYCCYNGWYKRPQWNFLKLYQFGKYRFHTPYNTVYQNPKMIYKIEGYIQHTPTKHSQLAKTILFLMYEKGYLKRWYKSAGIGWRMAWWLPKNYLRNIIHLIKHGRNSVPFTRKNIKYFKYDPVTDELPF